MRQTARADALATRDSLTDRRFQRDGPEEKANTMDSVVIVAPAGYDVVASLRSAKGFRLSETRDGTVVVEDGRSRVYVARNDAVLSELPPERRAQMRASVPVAVFWTVDFSDVGLCRAVLTLLAVDAG